MPHTLSLEQLFASPLFHGLTVRSLEKIHALGAVKYYGSDSLIIEEGRPTDSVYIVISGKVKVYLPDQSIHKERFSDVFLTALEVGDCFGEYALIDGHPASASVMTMEACKLFVVPDAAFSELLEQECEIGRTVYKNLLRILTQRLRKSNLEMDVLLPV